MAEIYLTFGVKYGTPAEREQYPSKEAHPAGDWVTGNGYLTVVYPDGPDLTPFAEEHPLPARERARRAAHVWLGGFYAFEYDEPPCAEYAPSGEIGRLVLPGVTEGESDGDSE